MATGPTAEADGLMDVPKRPAASLRGQSGGMSTPRRRPPRAVQRVPDVSGEL